MFIENASPASICSHCGRAHEPVDGVCPLTAQPMDEPGLCGRVLDRYQLHYWLGGGGFGAVYRATHTVMGREVAFKVLHLLQRSKAEMVTRFFREARAATAIGSPHIIQVYDAGTTAEGYPFLAMEYVEGCSLRDVLDSGQTMPVNRAVRIALQMLDALGAAHETDIIHRDVKPANVMLQGTRPDGSDQLDYVKLVDFGISKFKEETAQQELTRSGVAMGTPGFAAPEQYMSARQVDSRADLYALSVMLYQMLSGALPFEAESYEEMVVRVCTADPKPLRTRIPHVPAELAMVIDRGMARDPADRWQTATEYAAALLASAEGIETSDLALHHTSAVFSDRGFAAGRPRTPSFRGATPSHSSTPAVGLAQTASASEIGHTPTVASSDGVSITPSRSAQSPSAQSPSPQSPSAQSQSAQPMGSPALSPAAAPVTPSSGAQLAMGMSGPYGAVPSGGGSSHKWLFAIVGLLVLILPVAIYFAVTQALKAGVEPETAGADSKPAENGEVHDPEGSNAVTDSRLRSAAGNPEDIVQTPIADGLSPAEAAKPTSTKAPAMDEEAAAVPRETVAETTATDTPRTGRRSNRRTRPNRRPAPPEESAVSAPKPAKSAPADPSHDELVPFDG